MSKTKITISEVVDSIYCERSVRLDATIGKGEKPAELARRAAYGTAQHLRFEREASDKRCFVATCIYGADAPETVLLRQYRDQHLLPSLAGTLAVRGYYVVSPFVVRGITACPRLGALIKPCIDRLVRQIERR